MTLLRLLASYQRVHPVRSPDTQTVMSAGLVAFCPSVSHIEYAAMGQTDGCQTITLHLQLHAPLRPV